MYITYNQAQTSYGPEPTNCVYCYESEVLRITANQINKLSAINNFSRFTRKTKYILMSKYNTVASRRSFCSAKFWVSANFPNEYKSEIHRIPYAFFVHFVLNDFILRFYRTVRVPVKRTLFLCLHIVRVLLLEFKCFYCIVFDAELCAKKPKN